MYQYLFLLSFQKIHEDLEWIKNEQEAINKLKESIKNQLTEDQVKIVENRAMRLAHDYNEYVFDEFLQEHGDEYGYDWGEEDFRYKNVDYDQNVYDIWTSCVKSKNTVLLTYDSPSSGMSKREVDPYKTNSPYGEGYCHKRQEVRKFRFDRVIDIKKKKKGFTKKAF